MSVRPVLVNDLLLILLILGLLSVALRPCLMMFDRSMGGAVDEDLTAQAYHPHDPVHGDHNGHGMGRIKSAEHRAATGQLPVDPASCHDSSCPSLEARELSTPQRALLDLLLKLPLLTALLWLLPLLLLWGPVRPPPPPPHLPYRPPPPLRFRVLLI